MPLLADAGAAPRRAPVRSTPARLAPVTKSQPAKQSATNSGYAKSVEREHRPADMHASPVAETRNRRAHQLGGLVPAVWRDKHYHPFESSRWRTGAARQMAPSPLSPVGWAGLAASSFLRTLGHFHAVTRLGAHHAANGRDVDRAARHAAMLEALRITS